MPRNPGPWGYTPRDVLEALAELGGEALIEDVATRMGRTVNTITLGLTRLAEGGEHEEYVTFSGPPDKRVVTMTRAGRENLGEDDLLDRWN
jgi:hypothetical protein